MAITTAMANTFKKELLTATHNFATNGNAFKLALYTTAASIGAATATFTTIGQVGNSGSYSSGGGTLTKVAPTNQGTTVGVTDFGDISFTTATIAARAAMIYNDTNGDKTVCTLDFGGTKTSTGGTFQITFPTVGASTAIIRIA